MFDFGHQARFVPTLVLERLRAVGEAAAVPKKSPSGSLDAGAAEAVDADERANFPKVRSMACAILRAQHRYYCLPAVMRSILQIHQHISISVLLYTEVLTMARQLVAVAAVS